ncbi:MAG: chemotaxis protein methyltransferase CheR [Paraglaciecola sp.]
MLSLGTNKEFLFNQQDFDHIREILYVKAGIRLADSKDSMVYSRLARRLRALKIPTFSKYLLFLHQNPVEEQSFINALTTNLTSFFREKHHFPVLEAYLRTHPGKKRIWCAASSTGEEPYSIAMTVAKTYKSFVTEVEIIASDIDSAVLELASSGVYAQSSIKNLNQDICKQFLQRGKGSNAGKVRVVPELRNMVDFRQINLTHTNWNIEPQVDVLFCRNVMIYFDKTTQVEILSRMVALMPADGLYIAGHSETFTGAGHLVTLIGKTVYQPAKGRN